MWQFLFGEGEENNSKKSSQTGKKSPDPVKHQTRILVLQEHHNLTSSQQNPPLYDSHYVAQKPPSNDKPKTSSVSPTSKPTSRRSNLSELTEMMFGTVPLNQRETTKVHFVKHANEVVITKVFRMDMNTLIKQQHQLRQQNQKTRTSGDGDGEDNWKPKPFGSTGVVDDEVDTMRERSKSDPDEHSIDPIPSYKKTFGISIIIKGVHINNSNPTSTTSPASPATPSTLSSNSNTPSSSQSTPSHSECSSPFTKGYVDMKAFVLSHFVLIEYRMRKIARVLKQQLEQYSYEQYKKAKRSSVPSSSKGSPPGSPQGSMAVISTTRFLPLLSLQQNTEIAGAVAEFQQSLFDLLSSPRLCTPVWLDMTLSQLDNSSSYFTHKRNHAISHFFNELTKLNSFESQRWNYLVSTAITALLGHHFTWISTIVPLSEQKALKYPTLLCKQLNELYGSLGTHAHTRVIVTGKHKEMCKKFLSVLSYVLRCSEVYYQAAFEMEKLWGNTGENQSNDQLPHDETSPRTSAELQGETRLHVVELDFPNLEMYHPSSPPSSIPSSYVNSPISSSYSISTPSSVSATPSSSPPSSSLRLDFAVDNSQNFLFSLGRSLLGCYCDRYQRDFALMAISNADFDSSFPLIMEDLRLAVDHPVIKSEKHLEIITSRAIVVDTEKCACEVFVYCPSKPPKQKPNAQWKGQKIEDIYTYTVNPSQHVINTLAHIHGMSQLGMPHDSCITYFDDRLSELVSKSVLFTKVMQTGLQNTTELVDVVLGVDVSDLGLLHQISSVLPDILA